jgi:hypothetical protein
MDGGCACGEVRYSIAASQPPVVYACHCTDCQRLTGSAFALQMPIFEAMLSLTGELTTGERTQPSGAVGTFFACAKCLSRIYSKNSTRPGMITVRAGTLDDSKAVIPKFHLWVKSRQSWVSVPDNAIALEEQPQSVEEWMQLLRPAEA